MIIGITIFATLFLFLLYALIFVVPKSMREEREKLENLDEFYVNKAGEKITLEELVQNGLVLQDEVYIEEDDEYSEQDLAEFVYSEIPETTQRKISIMEMKIVIKIIQDQIIGFSGTSESFALKIQAYTKEFGIDLLTDELEWISGLVD